MKKASLALLVIFLTFIILTVGMLIGRSTRHDRISISYEASAKAEENDTTQPINVVSDDGKININEATAQHLMLLPNIGETLAVRIIDYRAEHGPFSSVDDLLFVKGIGSSRLEDIRHLITVGG